MGEITVKRKDSGSNLNCTLTKKGKVYKRQNRKSGSYFYVK